MIHHLLPFVTVCFFVSNSSMASLKVFFFPLKRFRQCLTWTHFPECVELNGIYNHLHFSFSAILQCSPGSTVEQFFSTSEKQRGDSVRWNRMSRVSLHIHSDVKRSRRSVWTQTLRHFPLLYLSVRQNGDKKAKFWHNYWVTQIQPSLFSWDVPPFFILLSQVSLHLFIFIQKTFHCMKRLSLPCLT